VNASADRLREMGKNAPRPIALIIDMEPPSFF
jgi:hypothetical protein